jgi:hypothetical protein
MYNKETQLAERRRRAEKDERAREEEEAKHKINFFAACSILLHFLALHAYK